MSNLQSLIQQIVHASVKMSYQTTSENLLGNDKLRKVFADNNELLTRETTQLISTAIAQYNNSGRGRNNKVVWFMHPSIYASLPLLHQQIIAVLVKSDNTVRTSKPKFDYSKILAMSPNYEKCTDKETFVKACAAVVWRDLMFYGSNRSIHKCLPMTAMFDVPGKYSENEALRKELAKLTEIALNCIVITSQGGASAWAQALFGKGL